MMLTGFGNAKPREMNLEYFRESILIDTLLLKQTSWLGDDVAFISYCPSMKVNCTH